MVRTILLALACASCLALFSCGSDNGTDTGAANLDATTALDASSDAGSEADAGGGVDTGSGGTKAFGATCAADGECMSNYCGLFDAVGMLCTLHCTMASMCPAGSQGMKCNMKGMCKP